MKKLLFLLARSNMATNSIGFFFAHFSMFLPVSKIICNKKIIGFKHPVPYWNTHYLIVPRKAIRSLNLANTYLQDIQKIFFAIFSASDTIAKLTNMQDYSLLVNGGIYQDVPQVHFHLCSGKVIDSPDSTPHPLYTSKMGLLITQSENILIYENLNAKRKVDLLIIPEKVAALSLSSFTMEKRENREALIDVIRKTQELVNEMYLEGYSLIINSEDVRIAGKIIFHLLSDKVFKEK